MHVLQTFRQQIHDSDPSPAMCRRTQAPTTKQEYFKHKDWMIELQMN